MRERTREIFNIAIVDDHDLMRNALVKVVNSFDNCEVVLQARNGKDLKEKINENIRLQLLILDVIMPIMDGYETSEWLNKSYPDIFVLALTAYDSETVMLRLLQNGVRGFIKKSDHPDILRNAIEMVIKQGFYHAPRESSLLTHLVKRHGNTPGKNKLIDLNDHEIEFLTLAATELTYKEIADKMNRSPRTIDKYRDTLFARFEVKSRVGLVLFAIKNGIAAPGI